MSAGGPTGHWYQLPQDSNFYQYAACTVVGEDARFYDKTTVSNQAHGQAVCSVDCLLPHKNAVLQLLTFQSMNNLVKDCPYYVAPPPGQPHPPESTCHDALIGSASNVRFLIIEFYCGFLPFTNLQAGNWMVRPRIWDITWASGGATGDRDFSNPVGLYNVTNTGVYGGGLYQPNDPRVYAWREPYASATLDTINDIVTDCSIANEPGTQQGLLDLCRSTYQTALGTSVVGHIGPILVVPSDTDLKPSMSTGCQYVYDVSDTRSCPLIDDMCKSADMRGTWRFSLSTIPDASTRMNTLPKHFCQNFANTGPQNAWISPPNTPDPSNQYFAGLGRQPDTGYLIDTTEPQSDGAYIYRSCALQRYDATPEFCCANDFADEGGLIFNPGSLQAPLPIDTSQPPGYHRSPLIGFPYHQTGTPWYQNCFDRNGLTCSVATRDITSSGCGHLMTPHCAVDPQNSSPESWDINATNGSSECSRWLGRLLYGNNRQWLTFLNIVATRGSLRDRTGTQLSSQVIQQLTANFNKVFTMKNIFDGTMSPLAQAMEPVMFSLYQNYDLALYDDGVLLNQCGVYTIDDVKNNRMLRRWCGCMLNAGSYGLRYPEVAIACTPTCNSNEVIQYGAACEGTLCVLDDITISLIDSTNGSVSLVQVCQSCGQIYNSDTQHVKQTCECQVDTAQIIAIDAVLRNISINEICGLSGNGGKRLPIPVDPPAQRTGNAIVSVSQSFPYTAAALLVIVAVLALVAYVVSRGMKKGASYLWARGLAVTVIIIAAIIIAAIAYSVIMMSISPS